MPCYRDAVYGDGSVSLENEYLRLDVHKRVTGWGWGELWAKGAGDAKFMAVLEHLAEASIAGLVHPLRLEAQDYTLEEDDTGQTLVFPVAFQDVEAPDQAFGGESALQGTVTLRLPRDEAVIYYNLHLKPQFKVHLYRLRGPWLRIGADSFGVDRHDAIFPGIEWIAGDEWSSGTDWFEHPQALRLTPHPHKVAFPLMALSHDGVGIGLSWTPDLSALSAQTRIRCPQPVFATPNFVDRRPHHLLGLMLPSARWGMRENALQADPPIMIPKGLDLALDGQISVVQGTSLDVVVDWVTRNGMPDPGPPRYEWSDGLERIARAYNSNLWIEGQGWGYRGKGVPVVPKFVAHYIEHGSDPEIVEGLKQKAAWCGEQDYAPDAGSIQFLARPLQWIMNAPDKAAEIADQLLECQTPEGDFPFDPRGRHQTRLLDWAHYWRPLGQPGDSVGDLCFTAAATLLLAGQKTGRRNYIDAARKTLDYALQFERPEGGDWWETPLYSPNLLAAGNGAIAYSLGYKQFGDPRYLERSRHWMRSVLPFTHLWEPADIEAIYNTKPCLNSTSWFLSDWVSKHVQWEILRSFSTSAELGIYWAEVDPEVDWDTYQRGVAAAVMRWMIDHQDPEWMFKSEYPSEYTADGAWDTLFADTYDPVHDTYGGGPISPEVIAKNVLLVLARQQAVLKE